MSVLVVQERHLYISTRLAKARGTHLTKLELTFPQVHGGRHGREGGSWGSPLRKEQLSWIPGGPMQAGL